MFSTKRRVLAIGAHPDDIELGAGGTIAKILPKHDVLCCTLAKHEDHTDILDEHQRAMKVLGVPKKNIRFYGFETRRLPEVRQEVCDLFWHLRREYDPDIVITHTSSDIHQDHNVISTEAKRAFRDRTLLGFEVHRSQDQFMPTLFIELSPDHLSKKQKALSHYRTHKKLSYIRSGPIKALAVARAMQIERPYVEAFEVVRLVLD